MEKQYSFTDMEYGNRRRTTKREMFLEKTDKIIPWQAWVNEVVPDYPDGSRGRRPREIEQMLRMMLLQTWFNLSDEGVEDAIYDSYAMKTFMQIDFGSGEQVPDATTLCKFRKLLTVHSLQKKFFDQVQKLLEREGKLVTGGTIVDATIVEASSSTKNKTKSRDPEMHSTRKNTKWYFGMRIHVGANQKQRKSFCIGVVCLLREKASPMQRFFHIISVNLLNFLLVSFFSPHNAMIS